VSDTYRRPPRLLPTLAALAALAACRDRAAEAPRGPSIELALDGAARRISIDREVPLASLVAAPPASWLEVRADSADSRRLELEAPSATYPDGEVRLYVERGRAAIGVFPSLTAGLTPEAAALARQPLAALGNLARVEVLTRIAANLPPLVLELAGRDIILTGEQLRALPAQSGGKSRPQGWLLADVIAAAAPGHVPRRVTILASGEASISIDDAALRDPEAIHVLKANQHGEYVLRVWHKGARRPTREVRRVTRLVID